jgi:hypothetical protein
VAPPAVPGAVGDEEPVPSPYAGPLTEASLPAPASLGAGWRRYVDPGGHEAGFRGNGSWVRERDGRDVVAGLVPVGCRGTVPAPVGPAPTYALEGTYTGPRGAPGVALALEFARAEPAEATFRGLAAAAESCGDAPAGPALRITVLTRTADTLVDRRVDPSEPDRAWTEVVVRDGRRVGLLTLAGPPSGRARPDPARVAAALRAALRRRG